MHEEIFIFISLFAAIFGLYFLRSRENMAMIEKGINPRKNYGGPKPYAYMKYGLMLIGAGSGLLLASIIDAVIPRDNFSIGSDNPAIYFALIAIGGGLGLFAAYRMEKKDWYQKRSEED